MNPAVEVQRLFTLLYFSLVESKYTTFTKCRCIQIKALWLFARSAFCQILNVTFVCFGQTISSNGL